MLKLSEVCNSLVMIAVAYTGEYEWNDRKFSISKWDLEEMERNLQGREVPIDYEHLSAGQGAPPGWSKAAGWIREPAYIEEMDDGRRMLWAWAEFTPACLAAVRQKEYRYFSPEIHWGAKDESGNVIGTRLAAGAITNRPHLRDLPPIEIAEADYPGLLQAVSLSESRRLLHPKGNNMIATFKERFCPTLSDVGFARLTAHEKVQHATKALMSEKKVGYADALREVTRDYPELWDEHRNNVLG